MESFSPLPSRDEVHFHKVIALHEQPILTWADISKQAPLLTRGWYELSRLPAEDRVEFTGEFWLSKIPCENPNREKIEPRIVAFFKQVEDVGIFATQQTARDPFEVHMVYSLKKEKGYFHGLPPASKESIANLERQFAHVRFPHDYLCFLEIHDGFNKYTDMGLISTKDMVKRYLKFQELLATEGISIKGFESINPMNLIPFYESEELHAYQCFNAEWYPQDEMGNLFFAQKESSFSEETWSGHHAFPTFLDWFLSYLEEL